MELTTLPQYACMAWCSVKAQGPYLYPQCVVANVFTFELVVFWVFGRWSCWKWTQPGTLKRWYPTRTLHGAETYKTTNSIFTSV